MIIASPRTIGADKRAITVDMAVAHQIACFSDRLQRVDGCKNAEQRHAWRLGCGGFPPQGD
jgi:hypothetical protein